MLALGKDAMRLALPACGRGHASGHAGSTTLCAGVRTRGPQRASMARRSTGACPGCSWHSVEPRESVWEGQEGQSRPFRERWCAEGRHDYEFSTRGAGGGLARRAARRQAAVQPLNSVFYIAPLAATACGGRRGRLASPALPTTSTRASARRPRRLRWARGARLSSGACSAGCAVQPGSLRAPLMRRGAAGGDAAAHAALRASPSCPRQVADATCCSRLPCPSLPSRKHTHTHTHAHTHY